MESVPRGVGKIGWIERRLDGHAVQRRSCCHCPSLQNTLLDAHTFYSLVGYNSVTLPAARQGIFLRELDNGVVLRTITVPSLIIQGKNDRIVLSASSDNIARQIPHVVRVDYAHCGHVAFVEAAAQFNRDVVAFMQRVQA